MKKNEKLRIIARLVLAIFILSTLTVILSIKADTEATWTPAMMLLTGLYLYVYCIENEGRKWLFFTPKKNARRSAIHTSKKVIPFKKLTTNKISEDRRAVK